MDGDEANISTQQEETGKNAWFFEENVDKTRTKGH